MSISSQQFNRPRGSVSLLGLVSQPVLEPGFRSIRKFAAVIKALAKYNPNGPEAFQNPDHLSAILAAQKPAL